VTNAHRTLLPNEPMPSDGDEQEPAAVDIAVRIQSTNSPPGGPAPATAASPDDAGTPNRSPRPLRRTLPATLTSTVAVQPATATGATLKLPKAVSLAVPTQRMGTGISAGIGKRSDDPDVILPSAHNRRKSVYGGRRASRAAGRVNGRGGWKMEESDSASSGKYRFFYGSRGEKLTLSQAILNWLRRRWILNPRGRKRQYWNFLIFVILIFYVIEIPLRLGFAIDNCNTCVTTILHLLCDIVFCIDLALLQPRTSFYMDELNKTALESSARKIAHRYFTGWFAFDLLTSLPIHHVLVYYYDVNDQEEMIVSFYVQFAYLLRMLKIFRFVELLAYYHSVELSAGTIWADLLKVFKFVFGFFCIAHMSACLWMFIALKERVNDHVPLEIAKWHFNSWPGNLGYATPPNASTLGVTGSVDAGIASALLYEQQTQIHLASDTATLTTDLAYAMALYWSVSTMTTVGYGDITPRNSVEIGYACIVIFIGSITFGYIISNVSSIIAIEDDTDTKIKLKIQSINAYMAHRKLPPAMQKKIRTHYEYTWKRKTVYDEREILQQLPTHLRTRVALYLNQDLIRNVAFLRDLGSDCLALLVTELRPFRVGAGYWIFKQGSLGREMCFVAEGIVEVLGKKNKQLAVLQRGSYFGEFALLSEKPTKRSASVRALAATDLFALTKRSFDAVLRVYPELREEVQAHAEARLAEAMQGNQERDYTVLPTLPAAGHQNLAAAAAVAAGIAPPAFGGLGGSAASTPAAAGAPIQFNVPGTPQGGSVAHRFSLTPMQRPSFVATPRGGLFPRAAPTPATAPAAGAPAASSSLLAVPTTAHGRTASVSTLGFNPYLSLPASKLDGESEADLRRTLLKGKEELETIMHPERAEEIALETAADEARLNAQVEAEQEFIHLTSAVAGVAAPGTPAPAAPSTPFVATLAPVSEDEHGGAAQSATLPSGSSMSGTGTATPVPRPRAPSTLQLEAPMLPLPLLLPLPPAEGDSSSGSASAGAAFLSHLSASLESALQPLHESQRSLAQMQRSFMDQQRELDELVKEIGL